MELPANCVIEPLNVYHHIDNFRSGDEEIDYFLRAYARNDMMDGLSRTFVAVDEDRPISDGIVGFFTLRAHALKIKCDFFESMLDEPDECTVEVPLIELMYLARDLRWKGRAVGPLLLVEALVRVDEVADRVGILGVHLRTTMEGARLYQAFDFPLFTAYPLFDPARYLVPIKTVRNIVTRTRELTD